MTIATPSFLIAAANAFVGLELSPTHTRIGLWELIHREVNCGQTKSSGPAGARRPRAVGPRGTWDAAFAYHVGFWSHYDDRFGVSSWPLPPVASAQALGRFATAHGMLEQEPLPGDLFLLYSAARKTYVRTGVVVRVDEEGAYTSGGRYDNCVVIEGDTNAERDHRGGKVLRHLRKLSAERGDCFIRWTSRVRRVIAAQIAPAIAGCLVPQVPEQAAA